MSKQLLFTREKPLEQPLQQLIEEKGNSWQQIPLISLHLMAHIPPLSLALEEYDWLFFTSAAAVSFFYQQFGDIPEACSLAVIGSKTFAQLKKTDQLRAEYPSLFVSEPFVAQWLAKQPAKQRILFPQSELSRKVIQERLREAGHLVDDFVLYHNDFLEDQQRTLKKWLALEESNTVAIFASPSAWENFHHYYQLNPFPLSLASIGPVTTNAIERSGYSVTYEAPECTMVSLVNEILKAEVKHDKLPRFNCRSPK